MIRPLALAVLLCLCAGCGEPASAPADAPAVVNEAIPVPETTAPPATVPDKARVRIETAEGAIVVELDGRRAPVTAANFLAYVDQHRFDGTYFYRAARTRNAERRGFIQGGIRRNYRRMLPPIAHEPTSRTGLRHVDGAISMARAEGGAGAMGDFFITVGAMPQMDADGGDAGFAAFGRVVEGMGTVRRILAAPTVPNAGRGAMKGQMIVAPIPILSARRVD